jgi:hypothetical protein
MDEYAMVLLRFMSGKDPDGKAERAINRMKGVGVLPRIRYGIQRLEIEYLTNAIHYWYVKVAMGLHKQILSRTFRGELATLTRGTGTSVDHKKDLALKEEICSFLEHERIYGSWSQLESLANGDFEFQYSFDPSENLIIWFSVLDIVENYVTFIRSGENEGHPGKICVPPLYNVLEITAAMDSMPVDQKRIIEIVKSVSYDAHPGLFVSQHE